MAHRGSRRSSSTGHDRAIGIARAQAEGLPGLDAAGAHPGGQSSKRCRLHLAEVGPLDPLVVGQPGEVDEARRDAGDRTSRCARRSPTRCSTSRSTTVSTPARRAPPGAPTPGRVSQPALKAGPRWLWASTTAKRGFSTRCSARRSLRHRPVVGEAHLGHVGTPWPGRAGYLMLPAVRPPTSHFSMTMKRMTTGTMAISDEAKRYCHSTRY